MTISFCSFSSGSSGNCYLVRSENTSLLVDAGISGKRIFEGLEMTGTSPETLKGLLITHEHVDHVRSVRVVSKKAGGLCVYANGGTWGAIRELVRPEQQREFVTGEDFEVGDIRVKPFRISHDAAEPVGYSFFSGDKQISIVTDTGYITDEIFGEIREADLLVLEANHEVGLLEYCRYPFPVKRRILGEKGHLSNVAAGEGLCRLLSECEKKRRVLLAHLSRENNTPEMARLAIRNILEEAQFHIGGNLNVDVIVRDQISAVYEL